MCNECFLVVLESVKTPVRHQYSNFTDEWYSPDGVKYEDESVIEEIKSQATDENRIEDSTSYKMLMNIYDQNEFIKTELADMKLNNNNGFFKSQSFVAISSVNSDPSLGSKTGFGAAFFVFDESGEKAIGNDIQAELESLINLSTDTEIQARVEKDVTNEFKVSFGIAYGDGLASMPDGVYKATLWVYDSKKGASTGKYVEILGCVKVGADTFVSTKEILNVLKSKGITDIPVMLDYAGSGSLDNLPILVV